MVNIAIFASGSGTNAENIINYSKTSGKFNVSCILCNNPDAYVRERAKNLNVPFILFNKEDLQSEKIISTLNNCGIDFLVLAGFLWLIPDSMIKAFPDKIINIHPALLPKYGGKGMYGSKVHEAVVLNKERESGITIHLVNEKYDEGKILFQASCELNESESADSLAKKIHHLEYEHFPRVVEEYILNQGIK